MLGEYNFGKLIRKLLWADEGATIIEYGLLAALISITAIIVISAVGGSINELFEKVENAFN